MKKNISKKHMLAIISLLIISILALNGCAKSTSTADEAEYALKIAATSSQLTSLVSVVGGDKIQVKGPVIPPTVCPGHYDIKPEAVADFRDCDGIVAHTFEPFVDKVVSNIDNPDLKVVKIEVIGAWMAPEKQKEAVNKVLAEVKKLDPDNSAYYEKNTADYINKIDQVSLEMQQLFKEHETSKGKVICQQYQQGLMEWMGFEVIGTYERPDSLTPEKIKELIDTGNADNAALVVDQLQVGPEAGKEIAESIGAENITVSFYPGGLSDQVDYFAELEANVELVLNTWDKKRQ